MTRVEQEMRTISSHSVFSSVRVDKIFSLAYCFCRHLFVFCLLVVIVYCLSFNFRLLVGASIFDTNLK